MKRIYLIRHGETAWTLSQQHTGITDIPLTKKGEEEATLLGKKLHNLSIAKILCSPLKRALMTCKNAGLLERAEIEPDLVEWNYGEYEGMTSLEIWKKSPNWNIFLNGAPKGESVAEIRARAGRVLKKIQTTQGDVALFSHGHFLRAFAATWLQLSVEQGRHFALDPTSLSILGFERDAPVIQLWNFISESVTLPR